MRLGPRGIGASLLLAAVASSSPLPLSGLQDPDTGAANDTEVVEYRNGAIAAAWIPYGRFWNLEGDAGQATVVTARLQGEGVSDRLHCWRRPGPDDSRFSLLLPSTRLGADYELTLSFYRPFEPAVLRRVAASVFQRAVTAGRTEGGVTDAILRSTASEQVARETESPVRHIAFQDDGGCRVVDGLRPGALIPEDDIARLAEAGLTTAQLERQESSRAASQRDVQAVRRDPRLDDLQDALVSEASLAAVEALTAPVVGGIVRALEDATVLEGPALGALLAFASACESETLAPETVCTFAIQAWDAHSRLAADVEEVSYLREQVGAQRTELTLEIEDALVASGEARFTSTAWSAKATSDKLRVSTLFGYSAAALDRFGAYDGFALLALKIYGQPVDKSLPDPYPPGFWSRASFVLGAVSDSEIEFEGRTLDDVGGGLKPLAGMGWDVSRDVTFVGGVLAVREPSANPAAKDRSRIRFAAFLGLGFDFDALNRIKGLFPSND